MDEKCNAQVIFDAGQTAAEPKFLKGQVPYVVIPENSKLLSLENMLPSPLRRKGGVTLNEVQSFIRYVQDYKTENTAIFANLNESGGSFIAIFDYHGRSASAGWCEDRAFYNCPVTIEWKRWSSRSGKSLSQREFAEFLEESTADVVSPSGAEILEIVKTLMAKTTVDFTSGVRLDNGNVQLVYQENTEAKAGEKGNLQVPAEIKIGVPVFLNGPRYAVTAKLRYRIESGKLTFRFDLMNPHVVIKDACDELVRVVREQTQIEPFLGSA